jgi:hypothetical protein
MKKTCIFNIKRTIKELNHLGSRRVHEDFQELKGSHRSRWFFQLGKYSTQVELLLTLIRAAGGVYDFLNFEEVYLCNSSRSDLQISCIPRKTSREYILLNTLEQKTAFSAIYRPKRA